MKSVITLALALAGAAFAQTPANPCLGTAPLVPCVTLNDYSSTYLIYSGVAPQFQQPAIACTNRGSSCIQRSDSTLTSIAVATNVATVTCSTACGVWKGQQVSVFGATVDTDLNTGTSPPYAVTSNTSTTATTYTFTTANVADGTYTEATLQIATSNPLTTESKWTITVFKYDGSNLLITSAFANASIPATLKWSARASY